jgi:hypothetical protein
VSSFNDASWERVKKMLEKIPPACEAGGRMVGVQEAGFVQWCRPVQRPIHCRVQAAATCMLHVVMTELLGKGLVDPSDLSYTSNHKTSITETHADKFDLCSRGTQQYAPLVEDCLHNLISAVHTFAEGILFAHAPLRHSFFPLLSSPPWVKGSAVCPSILV